MKNARVRFAIDDDGSLYDYQNQRSYAPVGILEDGDATWDLAKVKWLIEAGLFVDSARVPNTEPAGDAPGGAATSTADIAPDKVAVATSDFLSDPALPPIDPTDPVVVAEQAGDGVSLNSVDHPKSDEPLDEDADVSPESLEEIEIEVEVPMVDEPKAD